MNVLDVDALNIGFCGEQGEVVPVVSDVSFSLQKGEILALVGESGCGKSISCMSLARLLPEPPAVIRGKVNLAKSDGTVVDVLSLPHRELRKIRGGGISYIFQEPSVSLNPVFRVGHQIGEVLTLHRPELQDPEAEIISLLRKVGIPAPEERMRCYPHELSGGMQQRIMIAMALASRPEILVADEPTTALDVTIQMQILDLLKQLRRDHGMSILLITHNLGIVSEMADRVCVMYAGRIVESGTVPDVIDHPCHPYTKALLRAVPVLGGSRKQLSTIPGTVPVPADYPSGCRFCGRCPLLTGRGESDHTLCRTVLPEYRNAGNGHRYACHFSEESV